ncbi:MAG: PepSY domain-containing protein [Gemmatimonadaceae bacterium]|nr:PepSY domain-containing protein [Gemmatimonadaceae bacterium]
MTMTPLFTAALLFTVHGVAPAHHPRTLQQKQPASGQSAPQTKPTTKPAYKADLPAALVRKARIAESAAAATALAQVPGGRIASVELEEEGGKLIYSYDIAIAGKKGVQEVHVDAMTGTVISSVHEADDPPAGASRGKRPESSSRRGGPPRTATPAP